MPIYSLGLFLVQIFIKELLVSTKLENWISKLGVNEIGPSQI